MNKPYTSVQKKSIRIPIIHQGVKSKNTHTRKHWNLHYNILIITVLSALWGGGGKIYSLNRQPYTTSYNSQQTTIYTNTPPTASKQKTSGKERRTIKKLSCNEISPIENAPQKFPTYSITPSSNQSASWYKTWWAGLLYACILIISIFFIQIFSRHRKIQKNSVENILHRLPLNTYHKPIESSGKCESQEATEKYPPQSTYQQETYKTQVTDPDRPTIEKAIITIKANLDSKEFDVKQFASEMCMSTSTLYRKIKNSTGLSPVELIRAIRLKEAYQLLTENKMSISEVANTCGFSTLWYFSKCFKLEFGILPTDLKKMKNPPKYSSQSRKILNEVLSQV